LRQASSDGLFHFGNDQSPPRRLCTGVVTVFTTPPTSGSVVVVVGAVDVSVGGANHNPEVTPETVLPTPLPSPVVTVPNRVVAVPARPPAAPFTVLATPPNAPLVVVATPLTTVEVPPPTPPRFWLPGTVGTPPEVAPPRPEPEPAFELESDPADVAAPVDDAAPALLKRGLVPPVGEAAGVKEVGLAKFDPAPAAEARGLDAPDVDSACGVMSAAATAADVKAIPAMALRNPPPDPL
jgi:hypothetical protein